MHIRLLHFFHFQRYIEIILRMVSCEDAVSCLVCRGFLC